MAHRCPRPRPRRDSPKWSDQSNPDLAARIRIHAGNAHASVRLGSLAVSVPATGLIVTMRFSRPTPHLPDIPASLHAPGFVCPDIPPLVAFISRKTRHFHVTAMIVRFLASGSHDS
jgi:hypothetical protein